MKPPANPLFAPAADAAGGRHVFFELLNPPDLLAIVPGASGIRDRLYDPSYAVEVPSFLRLCVFSDFATSLKTDQEKQLSQKEWMACFQR